MPQAEGTVSGNWKALGEAELAVLREGKGRVGPECREQGGGGAGKRVRIVRPGYFDPKDVLNANTLNQNTPTVETFLESVFQFERYSFNLIP